MLNHPGSIPLKEARGDCDQQMPIPRFLNSLNVAGDRLLKVVFCKIEEAVRRTGPKDSRTRKTQTPYNVRRALAQVIFRNSLRSLVDLGVWKPKNAESGRNPEVSVRPLRQRTNGDVPRRLRIHLGKAVTI